MKSTLRFPSFEIAQGAYFSAAVVAFGVSTLQASLESRAATRAASAYPPFRRVVVPMQLPDLPHHVAAMDLHRGFGDAQLAGNLLI